MYQAMIIDDDEDYRNLLVRKLSRSFPEISIIEVDPLTMSLPDEKYHWEDIDFIVLDYQLGIEETGLDWFRRFHPEQMPAIILLTARGSEEIAVRAIRLGIDEYLVKENFNDERLSNAITECIYNKKMLRARHRDLSHKNIVFNKANFIHRLGRIAQEKDVNHHLLVINPSSFLRIGEERGLSLQDNYINHCTNMIYKYLASKEIECNIYIYSEEYIAVIIEVKLYRRHLKHLYRILDEASFAVGSTRYPCSASFGVISPGNLEENQLKKNDFEILSTARVLCESVRNKDDTKISIYGDINLKDFNFPGIGILNSRRAESLDIERVISDGRISANYQPWIYIATDETISLRDIYDVRIEMLDLDGNLLSQRELTQIMEDAFAKRAVDRWVLRHSTSQIVEVSRNRGKKGNVKLAVKISLSTVCDPEFIPWLNDLFRDAGIPNNSMMFEIELVQFLRNPDEFSQLIQTFAKSHSIKSVLSGIDLIPSYYEVQKYQKFDFIKLNVKDLVYGFPRSPLNKLIETIKDHGSKIIAVCVDDAEILNLAVDFDIDYVQGYFVGKPQADMIIENDGDIYAVI